MFVHGLTRPLSCALAAGVAGLATPCQADDLLRLWGVDAADAQVFAIDDVRNPQATFNDYGRLHVAGDKTADPVTSPIRAFTVVNTFEAYAVVEEPIAGFDAPVLIGFDLRDVDNAFPLVAEAIGTIDLSTAGSGWRVTGIAGDPLYAVMHVLIADGDPSTNDRVARVRATRDRAPVTEHVSEIRWEHGGVRMGADITMGPAGLLLVGDEGEGRVVIIDPESGEVRGVRLEGIRVDTDTAQYAGLAWDGYNDRTAMFDRRTGQLIIANRQDNSISAFDLRGEGVDDAEGLAFVFRPDPPGEGSDLGSTLMQAIAGVNNTRLGSHSPAQPTPGTSGGGSGPLFDLDDLLDDLEPDPDDPNDEPVDERPGDDDPGDGPTNDPPEDLDDDLFEEEDPREGDTPEDPGPGGGTGGDPPNDPPVVPSPAGLALLAIGLAVARGRRGARGG